MAVSQIALKDAVEQLKSRISNHRMDLLVGAGVSMCVSDKFMSWNDLLTDMVVYLYQGKLVEKGITVQKDPDYECHYTLIGDNAKEVVNEILTEVG